MISLQKLFSKDDKFFDLLEASAHEGNTAVKSLTQVLSQTGTTPSLQAFHDAKEADKRITDQINEALLNSFVAQLEREDIEALSATLYKIPKTVEKFVERFIVYRRHMDGVNFSRHVALLEAATTQVVALVKMLRTLGAGKIQQAKEINGKLQQIEGDADKLIMELLADLYSGRHEPVTVLARRDLFDLLEDIVDRCRDAGNVVTHIVLKNS